MNHHHKGKVGHHMGLMDGTLVQQQNIIGVTLAMPTYIPELLHKYQHRAPQRSQHAPHAVQPCQFGSMQQPTPADTSPELKNADKKQIMQIIGSFLYYARAIDSTLLVALNSISKHQKH